MNDNEKTEKILAENSVFLATLPRRQEDLEAIEATLILPEIEDMVKAWTLKVCGGYLFVKVYKDRELSPVGCLSEMIEEIQDLCSIGVSCDSGKTVQYLKRFQVFCIKTLGSDIPEFFWVRTE